MGILGTAILTTILEIILDVYQQQTLLKGLQLKKVKVEIIILENKN
jgi:hypothetical protein